MRLSLTLVAAVALALCMPAAGLAVSNAASSAPLRTLVYSFTYGVQGDLTVHSEQGVGQPVPGGEATSGSGISQDYSGEINDKGTITVNVIREQPDTGLIVSVSEQAEQTRKADAATCVVYGTTNVICDPNKTINSEELALLRFLGRNFVDPNKLDAKGHWRAVDESNAAEATTADYTLTPGQNGSVTIDGTRVVKELQGRPVTTDATVTINYDVNRQVPTKISEYVTERQFSGADSMMKTTVQTTLTLVSDSMAMAKP
jgi:hypothetical protein